MMTTLVSTKERIFQADFIGIARVATLFLMIGFLAFGPVGSTLAAGNQGGIGDTISGLVTSITDTIQSIVIVAAILGLTLYGLGKVLRPVFPQLSQMTNNYITEFIIGIVVVYSATAIAEGIAGMVS